MKSATLIALAGAVSAAPALNTSASNPARPGGTRFSLKQVANPKYAGPDGPLAVLRAHSKYAGALPDVISKALDINADLKLKFLSLTSASGKTAKVKATPAKHIDSEYRIMVQIGTPPQSIPLNLDTGSSDLWTFSTDTYPGSVHGQVLYNAADSSTSKRMDGATWSVRYGDGSGAGGTVYTDKVSIGGVISSHQAIQVAVDVAPDIASDDFVSGILGLASSEANTVLPKPQKTFIDNVQAKLEKPIFTANLKSQEPGNYNFGYIDDSEYTGDIQYAAINPYAPYYEVSVDGYAISGENATLPFNAIVDTGTSLLLVPQDAVDKYYAKIKGSGLDSHLGMMVYPCSESTPDFDIVIGNYSGHIPGKFMHYGQTNDTYCFGGIQTSLGIPFSVLGDVFLKAQFVVFDYGNALVGFANKDMS